mmetsp:Transcript_20330/g.48358  ORF Transcript_20330/g.48358 Transcript_20330/m.48358 type:complete len:264 (+) Transcript_20330:118-909(+)
MASSDNITTRTSSINNSTSSNTENMVQVAPTYEKYIGLVEKALKKSRSDIDTKELIRLAYGDDTAPFGGDEMLGEIMDGVLDKLAAADKENGTVLPQFKNICEQQRAASTAGTDQASSLSSSLPSFQDRLNVIDAATNRVMKWETELAEAEKRDKNTAQSALANSINGGGSSTIGSVTVDEIVMYREYQEKLIVQKQLQEQLAKIQDEADQLQADCDNRQNQVETKLMELGKVEKNLEAAADICSMGFVHPTTTTTTTSTMGM